MANPYGNPTVDFFGALSGIGDTIQQNRDKAAMSGAVADATGPDGKIDFSKLSGNLIRSGLADKGITLAQLADTKALHEASIRNMEESRRLQEQGLGQTATMNSAQIENMRQMRDLQERTLAETTRQHDLALTKPVELGSSLSGPIFAARKADGTYERIDPVEASHRGGRQRADDSRYRSDRCARGSSHWPIGADPHAVESDGRTCGSFRARAGHRSRHGRPVRAECRGTGPSRSERCARSPRRTCGPCR
jgi:hypothetical protein